MKHNTLKLIALAAISLSPVIFATAELVPPTDTAPSRHVVIAGAGETSTAADDPFAEHNKTTATSSNTNESPQISAGALSELITPTLETVQDPAKLMKDPSNWVARKHHENTALINHVAKVVAGTSSDSVIAGVPQEGSIFFGRTLPTKASMEYPFLNFVSEQSALGAVNTIEFGCSVGLVSTKVPFCFQNAGKHIGIDFSGKAIEDAKSDTSARVLRPFGLEASCNFVKMDCLKVLEKAPLYKGKINAIYSQNLIHFFNPDQVVKFFDILDKLLVAGGRAFICADSLSTAEMIKFYNTATADKTNVFPGFITAEASFFEVPRGTVGHQFHSFSAASNEAKCQTVDVETPELCEVEFGQGVCTAYRMHQRATANYFTTKVFHNVVKIYPGLKIIKTFYMDENGIRLPDETFRNNLSAVAIVEKRA